MNLFEIIDNHKVYNEEEKRDIQSFKQFLENFDKKDWAVRENLIGHLTASAWVVNKEKTKVLFAYHNIYQSWAWLGGHADGDYDLLNVATKEAMEESGIKALTPIFDKPIDVSINGVMPHNKRGEYIPSHLHYNCVYLFEASENQDLQIAEGENSDVAWINMDEVLGVVSEEDIKPIYKRIIAKVKAL